MGPGTEVPKKTEKDAKFQIGEWRAQHRFLAHEAKMSLDGSESWSSINVRCFSRRRCCSCSRLAQVDGGCWCQK